MAKLSDLGAYASKMFGEKTFTLNREEQRFILEQIDEELGRNKSVLHGKNSKNVKDKTRERFERQKQFLERLRAKMDV